MLCGHLWWCCFRFFGINLCAYDVDHSLMHHIDVNISYDISILKSCACGCRLSYICRYHAMHKILYGGIIWVHNKYYDMLWLFFTFRPSPLYSNGQCLFYQYTNVNFISKYFSPNLQYFFSVAFVLCLKPAKFI